MGDDQATQHNVQYRLLISKGDERTDGPDDADVVIACPADALDDGAAVAFMRGKLKASGNTGSLLDALASGQADRTLSGLAE